ncbi:MAG: dienelactone hydrolase family protein [Bacteroidota bacterium]|jgi:phospholipase/carboxylesterase
MTIHKIGNTVFSGKSLDEAKKVLIMVHGRGANAQSILSLADHLLVKDFAFVAPNATGNTWYPQSFLAPEIQNEPYLSSALDLLTTLVNQLKAKGFEAKNIYFTGFSQGACLTSEFLGRNAERFGGAFIFTGGLIGDSVKNDRYQGNFAGTPIFIGSSNPDFHVPVERVYATSNIFRDLGATVTEKIYPNMAHTIIDDEINEANKILILEEE